MTKNQIKKVREYVIHGLNKMVGASRFERPTTRTPNECATRLRHAPNLLIIALV